MVYDVFDFLSTTDTYLCIHPPFADRSVLLHWEILRRNKQKIYVSLRETCIRIGLFLILLANVYFIGLNVHHMNHETYLGVVKKKEICSDVNKYLFITKKMRRIIIRDY